ncbi:MAG: VOC family protein [Bacillus subtilis]|nr:VOC family protein [Bacillus subtilis]
MTNIRFDHFITYTSAENVDDYIKEYAAQGFTPDDQTVRHEPGLRNCFIFLGAEYIEFCWVEDEELFAKGDDADKSFRSAARPFGIGLISEDVQAVHDGWTKRGYSVPDVWSKAPRDAAPDVPPVWSFQDVPPGLLPGVSAFVLTYHRRKRDDIRKVLIHPNTTYALSEVTYRLCRT